MEQEALERMYESNGLPTPKIYLNKYLRFIHTHTNRFMQYKNKAILIGTVPVILTIIAVLTGKALSPGVSPGASGTGPWPQEALSIVTSIEESGHQWSTSKDNLEIGQKIIDDARAAMTRAEAAAKGADLTLCAKFQARYDRTNKTLVSDQNCPLN